MTAFRNGKSDDAVARFKADFNDNEELFRYGQFLVTWRFTTALLLNIETELENNVLVNLSSGLAAEVNAFFRDLFAKNSVEAIDVSKAFGKISEVEVRINSPLTSIRALFPPGSPTQKDMDDAVQAFRSVWSSDGLTVVLPYSGSLPTLRRAIAAKAFESDRCFEVATNMARKILKKHKVTNLNPKYRISYGTIPGVVAKEESPGPVPLVTQKTIVYGSQAELDSVVSRMRSVIDTGGLIQCGVMSGVRQDNDLFKKPEHYVLVFDYCQIEGKDAFMFWDPDAGRSNITSAQWGPGFGCLFHASKRLSTAIDDADLLAIERNESEALFGDHTAPYDRRRHCYQVYWVQTRPQ